MNAQEITRYLKKFAAETHTEQEKQVFLDWLKTISPEEADAILDQYHRMLDERYPIDENVDAGLVSRIEANLDRLAPPALQANEGGKLRSINWFVRVAAAVIAIFVLAATLYYTFRSSNTPPHQKQYAKKEQQHVAGQPGGDKATLTLSDNSVVVLDDAFNGAIAEQGNVKVEKLGNGQLVYDVMDNNNSNKEVAYNTLTTPKGGQFKLTLPDGSKVWLNAASSIKYPTVFTGNTREVQITGEAYFEVQHDDQKPFHVLAGSLDVEDMGTAFNINAYDNEAVINTTLVEGIVKVSGGGNQQQLAPGQQSLLHKNGELVLVKNADVKLAVAWKNGFTQFKSADIQSIMRQVERWYDLEVVYEGDMPKRSFTGGVARDAALSELLKILELSKIHFRIEGKKLIVTP